jgi:2-(1,2-epoxy-1,2-dihydrophenyl)acetyl-CoA isomerase
MQQLNEGGTMSAQILFERRDGVARISFNRPEVKNAICRAMVLEMTEILQGLAQDDQTRVVVFDGKGRDFSSGGDLNDMADIVRQTADERVNDTAGRVRESAALFIALDRLPQPVVASVRGHAVGAGMEIVIQADLVVASETAKFSVPQVRLAHSVDHGESYFLPRKIGLSRAAQLALLGDRITAAEADKFGLVNWVVPDDQLEAKTSDVVRSMAQGANVALRRTKKLFRGSLDRSMDEQFAAERDSVLGCIGTRDFGEAIAAFFEKRAPQFQGR